MSVTVSKGEQSDELEVNLRSELMPVQVKHVADVVGEWGPVQRQLFIFCFVCYIMSPYNNLTIPFYAPKIGHSCERSDGIYTNWTTTTACDAELQTCVSRVYDHSFYRKTIVDEWDLVCDIAWYPSLAQSVHQLGYAVSGITFGLISDHYGRLFALKIAMTVEVVAGFSQALSISYYMFLGSRFFLGACAYGRFLCGYLLIMEWVGPRIRGKIVTAYEYGYGIGKMSFPGVFYFVRHFRYMQAITSTIQIITLIPLYFTTIAPESPRWQMIHGQYKDAEESIKKAANQSGKLSSDDINSRFDSLKLHLISEQEQLAKETKNSLFDLLKISRLRNISIILYYAFFSHAFIAYGSYFNVGSLGGSIFINVPLYGLSYIVSVTLVLILLPRFGRKTLLIFLCLGQAVCFLAMIPFSFDDQYIPIRVGFAMLASMFVTCAFNLLYLYSAETFPTSLRQVGIGSCSIAARVGSVLAPFVKELTQSTHLSVSFAIFGSLALVNCLIILFVPETKDKEIPDTLKDADEQT